MTTTRTPAHTAATASTPRNTVSPQDVAETLPSGTWQQEAYQDGRGTSAYGASTYGTYGFDASQYGAASATTQLNLQAASAITVSPQVGTGHRRRMLCGFCSRSLFSSSPWGFPGSMMPSRPVLSASSGRSVRAVPLLSQRLPASVSGRVGCAGKAALGTGASDRAHHFLRDRLGWHSPCMRCPTGCPRSMTL